MSDKNYAEVQSRTFTKWANTHLKGRGIALKNVVGDLEDGINLCYLLEAISGEPIQVNKNPRQRIHKIENVNRALKFIEQHDVKLAGTGAEEIVDLNEKMTLGLIWTIILRFVIAGLSEEGMSAKQGLLLWCQKKLEPYKPKAQVDNFTSSWTDGLAFCGLIHRHRPDLISMDDRDSSNAKQNLIDAFEIAERELGIPKLLEVEDIYDVAKPDEKSVMTYVAQYYAYFSGLDKYETSARRIANFLAFQKQIGELIHDYEERTRALQHLANTKSGEFRSAHLSDSYQDTVSDISNFREYRRTQRRSIIQEKDGLVTLFNSLQLKLKAQGLQAYVPPHGLSLEDTAKVVEELSASESHRRSTLNQKLREIQERAQKKFADLANEFFNQTTHYKQLIKGLSGDLEHQLNTAQSEKEKLNHLRDQIPSIKHAEDEQIAANVEVNDYTDHTTDDLSFELDQLEKLFDKAIELIRNQISASKNTGVDPSKLAEFNQAFHHFDLDKDGVLNRLELKSALSSLGVIDIDFEGGDKKFEEIFKHLVGSGTSVGMDAFSTYMAEKATDKMDSKQIDESFSTISNGKPFVTQDDLRKANVDAATVEYISLHIPQTSEGYDFRGYLNKNFSG
jgi:Ca2+-binding EF-hand superfamily protein